MSEEREPLDPSVWRIAGVVMFGPLMAALDSTIVNVSLATLSHDLTSPLTRTQWVISGYLLTLALTLPLSGWLVDRIGARALYLGAFVAFALTSLGCGASPTVGWLIFFRALQGMAGGLLAPMAQMMMARAAGRHFARVLGFMVVPIMIGPIFGPVLAGLILKYASWHWLFFINLPVAVLAIGLAWWILPRDDHATNPRPFDLPGFLMLSPGLVGLLHVFESTASTHDGLPNPAELTVSIILVLSFLFWSLRLRERALLDVRLFGERTFGAAASTQFLSNGMVYGGQMLVPLYLLTARAMTPTTVGLVVGSAGMGMLCSYPLMGTLTDRFGPRTVSSGGALIALAGTLPFIHPGLPIPAVAGTLFVRGVGLGCINIPSMSAAYASVSKAVLPTATTAINIVQRLGGPVGTCVLTVFLHHCQSTPGASLDGAFEAAFGLLCTVHALGLLSAMRLPTKVVPAAA